MTTWLLTAHLMLSTGEPVDILISMHLSEVACVKAIPAPRKGQRGRRYDCRPMSKGPQDDKWGMFDLINLQKEQEQK